MNGYSVVTRTLGHAVPSGRRCDACRRWSPAAWCEDCPRPDQRAPGLGKAELRWLASTDDRTPRRSASRIVHAAAERIQSQAGIAAAALMHATVALPPQQRGRAARRGSDVPDPALAQIEATIDAVDRGLSRLGHLLDCCLACDGGAGHNDPDRTITLALLTGQSWTEVVDHCVGVSATSPRAVAKAASKAANAYADGAVLLKRRWRDAHASGAEPDVLDRMASDADELSRRMERLAVGLGQWRPGPLVRLCACGCGRAAPPVGEGATRSGCRTRQSRQRRATA